MVSHIMTDYFEEMHIEMLPQSNRNAYISGDSISCMNNYN